MPYKIFAEKNNNYSYIFRILIIASLLLFLRCQAGTVKETMPDDSYTEEKEEKMLYEVSGCSDNCDSFCPYFYADPLSLAVKVTGEIKNSISKLGGESEYKKKFTEIVKKTHNKLREKEKAKTEIEIEWGNDLITAKVLNGKILLTEGLLVSSLFHSTAKSNFEAHLETVLAVFIAHEIKHYTLGHSTHNPTNELQADREAIKLLNQFEEYRNSDIQKVAFDVLISKLKDDRTMNESITHDNALKRAALLFILEYEFRSKLNEAFLVIRNGGRKAEMENALKSIENALNKEMNGRKVFSNNFELLRAKAVAQHKIWMYGCNISYIGLKPIIESKYFSDDEKFHGHRGVKLCNDEHGFNRAKKSYEVVREKIIPKKDDFIESNYFSLLALSLRDIKEYESIIDDYIKSAKESTDRIILNNLAFILFHRNKEYEGAGLLNGMTNFYNLNLNVEFFQKGKSSKENSENTSCLSVESKITPMLNYYIILKALDKKGDKKGDKIGERNSIFKTVFNSQSGSQSSNQCIIDRTNEWFNHAKND